MNIIFMGTPIFAVPCLEVLINAGHNIQYVFCQPDKPRNRGHKIQMPPVKEFAENKGIPVFQPSSLRTGADGEKAGEIIRECNPDCIVVVAYGQILPKDILDIPRYGCINIHASLLPRYRGAAPMNFAIINGETEAGVSVMYMSEGLDCGDVILQEKIAIDDNMTYSVLHDKLMDMGSKLILEVIPLLESKKATRTPQDNELSCYAPMIDKQMCKIDWSKPSVDIYNQIRGLSEVPAAFTFLGEKRLKVYFAKKAGCESDAEPGTVIDTENFTVVCGDKKSLTLTDIQLEGGKRMDTEQFLLGRKLEENTRLR